MNDTTKQKFVDLYNDAVLKIFPIGTMIAIFGNGQTLDEESNNKMILPTFSSTKIQEKIKKKEVFLEFMQTNFKDIRDITADDFAKLLDVNKNVKKFIERMEVKVNTTSQSSIEIVVTLHDIIDKLTSTDFSSVHCLSEKVFMAILLAIQKLHYPNAKYKLTFQFSKSLFGKSGLERSSVICSGDKTITESMDPVDSNFFKLSLLTLNKANVYKHVESIKQSLAEANASGVVAPAAAEANASDVVAPAAAEANASDVVAAAEELQPTPLTGDELFEKMMKREDPSSEEKDTYQKIVLHKFKEGNYKVKSIEKWDYNSVREELKKSEGIRSEVLDLLSITPNGDVYKKLSYLVNIFSSSLNCKDNDCLKIYLITEALLPFFHTQDGGSKSRRRHRRHARKTRRGRTRKSKSKPKTHRRRRHSHVRKHKKYTSRRR